MDMIKAKVNQSDMKENMQQCAVDVAAKAICDKKSPVEVATTIREAFDQRYGASWTCIVGKDFSSSFAYEKKKHVSLEIAGLQILLFKSA
ncbi:unnamed protein product [Dibothriocephalus latus]|uniref:Dynein light chain n=1 Tax=Dibothriocephalus latus TaxID=60516 RepID=A0A3P7LRZ2_DIBLA|nr:unnamed protein product [Dibothriocephalus latus]